MGYFHEVQIFTNATLLALAEILTIQKFTTLSSCNQHLTKIYGSFLVRVTRTQQATMRDHDLLSSSSQFTINSWAAS